MRKFAVWKGDFIKSIRTHREYTHAVIGKNPEGNWAVFCWSGSLEIAKKRMAEAKRAKFTDVEIVEAIPQV